MNSTLIRDLCPDFGRDFVEGSSIDFLPAHEAGLSPNFGWDFSDFGAVVRMLTRTDSATDTGDDVSSFFAC